jgi:SAM-dependent methyltransferase
MTDGPLPKFRDWTKDRKLAPVADKDIDSLWLREEVIGTLDAYVAKTGKPRSEIAVLDFGCGRGEAVGWLRKRGWRAFGVEVDSRFVSAGALVSAMANDTHPVLVTASPDGRVPFPDGFFDVILSLQVLEHVSDLRAVVREMDRLLKPGGVMVHTLLARYKLFEPHYRLPFVHWLPKNGVRRACMRALIGLGFGVRGREPFPVSARTEIIYRYSVEETFYRPLHELEQTFGEVGIAADLDAAPNWRLARAIANGSRSRAALLRLLSATLPLSRLYNLHREVAIQCRKPAANSAAGAA